MVAQVSQTTDKEREEEEKASGTPISTGQSSQIGAGQSFVPAQGKGGSGQFTNIQKYIKANKPKTQQLGQKIAGRVGQKAGQIKSTLGETRGKFLGDQGIYGKQAKDFISSQISQAGKQPTQQEQLDRFAKYRTGKAGDPDLSKQSSTASDLERQAKEFQTTKGRQEQLQKVVGRRSGYTAGQQTLDRALLGGDRSTRRATTKALRGTTAGLGEQVSDLTGDISRGKQETQDFLSQQLNQTREAEQQAARERYNRLKEGFYTGRLSQEDLQRTGLEAGQRIYNADLNQILEQTKGLTTEDTARLDALAGLAGRQGRELFAGVQGGDLASNVANEIARQRSLYEGELARPTSQIEQFDQMIANEQQRLDLMEQLRQKYENSVDYIDVRRAGHYGREAEIGGSVDREQLENLYATERQKTLSPYQEQFDMLEQQKSQLFGQEREAFEDIINAYRKQQYYDRALERDSDPLRRYYGGGSRRDITDVDVNELIRAQEQQREQAMASLYDPYRQRISDIESRYGRRIEAAKNGGIMGMKIKALQNMRGY